MYTLVLMTALTTGTQAPDHWYGVPQAGCYYGCAGCHGCVGGVGCMGRPTYPGCVGCHNCYQCHGCYGCHGCWNWSPSVMPAQPGTAPTMPPAKEELPKPKTVEPGSTSQRGRLVIEVPDDARVTIDDQPTQTTSEVRVFQTPELEPRKLYYYIVKVEVVRDGQTLTEQKRVLIQAGEEVKASFKDLGPTSVATGSPR